MRLTVDQEASTLEMFDNLYMEVYSPYMYMREVQKGLCRKMFIWGTFVGHVQKSMETDIANYQNRYLGYMDTLEVNLVRRKLWKSVPWPYLP